MNDWLLSEPTIRHATAADVASLVHIEGATFDPQDYPIVSARQFRYQLLRGNAAIFVAESASGPVGYCSVFFRRNSRLGRLYSLAVLPAHRGRGVGSLLLQTAESACRAQGCTRICQEIRGDNTVLLARYLRQGYTQQGARQNYYPDGQACLVLTKPLIP